MSIKNEINSFEFESLDFLESEIIKNGFFDYSLTLEDDEAVDHWRDNADLLELILEDEPAQPETFTEILDLLQPFEEVAEEEVANIFLVKKFEEISSYYQCDPFLVSIIEVLYKNIDKRLNIEDFIEELVVLCEIVAFTIDKKTSN